MNDLKSKTVEELLADVSVFQLWDGRIEHLLSWESARELASRLEEAQQKIIALEKSHELVARAHENRIKKHLSTYKALEEAQHRSEAHDAEVAAKAREPLLEGIDHYIRVLPVNHVETLGDNAAQAIYYWLEDRAAEYRAKAGRKP
jgi:hypothetical protein